MNKEKLKPIEEYKEWLNDKLFNDAIKGKIAGDRYRLTGYRCEIYVLNSEGDVVDEYEVTTGRTDTWKKLKEVTNKIYEEENQEDFTVFYIESETHESEYYDPELMKRWRQNGIESHINNLEKEAKEEEDRQKRYARWKEACEWAVSMGCKLSTKYNTRDKTIAQIVKNGLEDDWNELFPEFAMDEQTVIRLKGYWGKERKG